MTKRESKNKFLSGNWYPVEETSTTELKITGELPRELSGLFLRNGPNPKEPINHENYHPFFWRRNDSWHKSRRWEGSLV